LENWQTFHRAPWNLAQQDFDLAMTAVIAQGHGRDIATPKEARAIVGLARQ
jgi:hypothetical protein